MDKIRIKENYENYDRVKKAFKDFVHALVWESMDIDAGVHEDGVRGAVAEQPRGLITIGGPGKAHGTIVVHSGH